ncbi:MAG: hypothetical protein U0703_13850 [Anaerolineae bacterium]
MPPTVLREGPRGLGSIQFYVEHDPQVNYFSFDESFSDQLMRMAAFDYLVNNADRRGHCLLDATGHIWGIDHGITFNAVQSCAPSSGITPVRTCPTTCSRLSPACSTRWKAPIVPTARPCAACCRLRKSRRFSRACATSSSTSAIPCRAGTQLPAGPV